MKDCLDRIRTPELEAVAKAFLNAGYDIRIAGGAVRDLMLGKVPKDIDLATDAKPEEMMEIAESSGFNVIPTGLKHGTLTVLENQKDFEITTLRADVETDGRHAEVEFVTDFKDDAARRDLTINAMFLDLNGELHDYFGGAEDLRNGIIRFVGDPARRVQEDYLRILRFFRFRGRFGEMDRDDSDSLMAIVNHHSGLGRVSGERIRDEVFKILSQPSGIDQYILMNRLGVNESIGWTGMDLHALRTANERRSFPAFQLGYAAIDENAINDLAERWRWSKDQASVALAAQRLKPLATKGDVSALKEYIVDGGFSDLVVEALSVADRSEEAVYFEEWDAPEFPVKGHDILDLGVAPGPEVGDHLATLRRAWKDSDYELTRDDLLYMAGKNIPKP